MKKSYTSVLFGFSVVMSAVSAFAGANCGHGYHHAGIMNDYRVHFGQLDANADNAVTPEEFKAYFENKQKAVFEGIDADKNGALSHEEWHAFKETHGIGDRNAPYHSGALPDPKAYQVPLAEMDKNADSVITWEEFSGRFPEADKSVFEALDMNRNGAVAADEWQAFLSAHSGPGKECPRGPADCSYRKDCPKKL